MILPNNLAEKAIDALLGTGADFAEIFVEDSRASMMNLESATLKSVLTGDIKGAGLRAFYGTESVFVSTSDLSELGLLRAVDSMKLTRNEKAGRIRSASPMESVFVPKPHGKESSYFVADTEKMRWLKAMDQGARKHCSEVTQVFARVKENLQRVQIINSEGLNCYDERPYCLIFAEVYVEAQLGSKESAVDNRGFHGSGETFMDFDFTNFAVNISDRAMALTKAHYAPAGEFPVIIENGFGGVIFHEACGHLLETTAIAKNASPFVAKINELIAHPSVTAIDDGTIVNGWGSLNIDDEGMPTQKTVLIEKGVLKSYMVDHMGSLKTGYARTGSGRRESYRFAAASRMRNTFIAPGSDKFEDMVSSVDFGLYAKKLGGGSVQSTGDFNFAVSEGYVIRKGRIEELVKGASLIGRGPEVLKRIVKVSDQLELKNGTCGSVSGNIPAAVGQPQILVEQITVGGRA